MKRLLVSCVLAVLMLASCASLKNGEATTLRVDQYIEQGNSDELSHLSASPFLIDAEIVKLPADTNTFWKSLANLKFRTGALKVTESLPTDASGQAIFGDSLEIRSFFAKYVDPAARVLVAETASGKKFAFVVKEQSSTSILYAFKGPY